MPEENEDESDYQQDDDTVDFTEYKAQKLHSPGSSKTINNKDSAQKVQQSSKMKSLIRSPTVFSPLCSPKTFPPNTSSLKPEVPGRNNEPITLLRLKSIRLTNSTPATSLPVSPPMSIDYSTSSVDSDGEAIVRLKLPA